MKIASLPEGRSLREPVTAIVTFGGVGLLPFAPGTWGSAAALPFGWLLAILGGWPALIVGAAIVGAIGWYASNRYVALTGREDPPEIVIDEVAAQWLALSVVPVTLSGFFAAFMVFRLFDTLKPWPASWADQEVEGGTGVMLDDLIAGLYTLLPLAALRILGVI
ncbi:MAG: phosphatidylglycerophosphatase A [Alphaproteobacteria bacterium]|nr:phosphatidylglycerophosphatase A [Alphaproteobacteria bacterium]